MKAIYLKGWITPQYMKEHGWQILWEDTAKKAQEQNATLVVFQIPKVHPYWDDPDLIYEIEKLIQAKYPPKKLIQAKYPPK